MAIDTNLSGLPEDTSIDGNELVETLAGDGRKAVPLSGLRTFFGRRQEILNRLLIAAAAAANNNPEDAPLATGVTLTIGTTLDASGTKPYSSTVNADAFRYTGGKATPSSDNTIMYFPVSSVAPATDGNLSGRVGTTTDLAANGWETSFFSEAPKVTIRSVGFTNTGYSNFFLVDGRYVSRAPTAGVSNGRDNYHLFDFAGVRAPRLITMMGSGQTGFQSVHVDGGSQVWAPPAANRIIHLAAGDSYNEGQGGSPTGQAAWVKVLGRLMGWTDVRQVAVGGTGYIATGSGRSKLGAQIARWLTVNSDITGAQVNIITIAAGYNDAGLPGVQAEALADYQAARALCPNAVIVVLGSWSGARGATDANTLAVEASIAAAFNAWADPLSIYIPVTNGPAPFFTGTGNAGVPNGTGNADFYVSPDLTHPTNAGHAYLARRVAPSIRSGLRALAA